jgi:microcystin-dependent protein
MPSHKHDFQDSYFSENVGVNNGFIGSNDTDMDNQLIQRPSVTATKGGDEAHENRPPFYVLAFLIKVI